jgi:hypothetical protein
MVSYKCNINNSLRACAGPSTPLEMPAVGSVRGENDGCRDRSRCGRGVVLAVTKSRAYDQTPTALYLAAKHRIIT